MTLTKNQIIESIQNQIRFLRKESYDIHDNILEIINQALESGDDVLFYGFGKFYVKDRRNVKAEIQRLSWI